MTFFKTHTFLLLAVVFSVLFSGSTQPFVGNEVDVGQQRSTQQESSDGAGVASLEQDLTKLTGRHVDVTLDGAPPLFSVLVTKAIAGKVEGGIKTLRVRLPDSKRQRNVPLVKVQEVFVDGEPLDVVYDKKRKSLIHSREKRAERLEYRAKVEKRLAVNRDRLWPKLTEAQQRKFLDGQKEFLTYVQTKMNKIAFRTVETEFFLMLTDLQPVEVDGYIAYLDAMYKELCGAFNLSPLRNIWCGKCVVLAFRSERDYLDFEFNVMENRDARGSQGICHSYGDGRVVFAGFQGERGFAHVLVHETAHGFVHRYRSSARAPSWLNEGMSDWLAEEIVKSKSNLRDQKISAALVMRQKSVGQFMSTSHISGEMYGAASALVEILLARDRGGQFKTFFDGIKEGKGAEQSLRESFGLSYQQLLALYFERIARQKH